MNNRISTSISSDRTLAQWLTHLEKLHPTEIELGLSRISTVGGRLNLIDFDAKVITVAGTNGKGTTCAYLEKILVDAGFKVGVYSSPHIHHYNERLRINHKVLDDAAHCTAFEVIENARHNISLSYFEYATLACLYLLQQQQCDFILLEVGLGGRLDATNMVNSDISVVTTIGIDHIDWLGSDREVIGFEKAGVFRANKPAICGELSAPNSLLAHAESISAQLILAGKDFSFRMIDEKTWSWHGRTLVTPIKQTLMPMQNASTALAVIESLSLNLEPAQLIRSIETASLAGRLQYLPGYCCDLYVDVAHNPQSAEYLASQLVKMKVAKGEACRVHAVVGMLLDKDIRASLDVINTVVSAYYFTDLACYRGARAEDISNAHQLTKINHQSVSCFEKVMDAVDMAERNANASDIIIVFGSFYTVSDLLTYGQK